MSNAVINKTPSRVLENELGVQSKLSKAFAFFRTLKAKLSYTHKPKQSRWLQVSMFAVNFAVFAMVVLMAPLIPSTLQNATHNSVSSISIASASGDGNIDIWWPTDGANVSGKQPLKALNNTLAVDKYRMVWQVDGGQQNEMQTSMQDYAHKESQVDLTGWNWKGAGPYTLSFTAYDFSGNKLGTKSENIYINNGQTQAPIPAIPISSSSSSVSSSTTQPPATTQSQPEPTSGQTKQLDVWWPSEGAVITGKQPFKTALQNSSVGDYTAYWQVDGGGLNAMPTNNQDYPHKEVVVDLAGWNWKGKGPYAITFTAKNSSGQIIGSKTVNIYVGQGTPTPAAPPSTTTPTPPPAGESTPTQSKPVSTPSNNSGNVFVGAKLYVNPNSDPAQWVNAHKGSDSHNASLMAKVAAGAETQWYGNWNSNVQQDVDNQLTAAAAQGALAPLVLYNIPNRDCGGYSAGGSSPDAYKQFVSQFVAGLKGRKTAVILEPDATSLIDCLSAQDLQTRYSLLNYAVTQIKNEGSAVYIDAGHPNWISASDMAGRLKQAGIDKADGFALNVSNFYTTAQNITYGQQISQATGGKHFVIETSRNGNGPAPDNAWCNPSGRALGQLPTTNTGNSLVDALLWIKGPGGSDGNCNGGPNAGAFFPDYALGLAGRASW